MVRIEVTAGDLKVLFLLADDKTLKDAAAGLGIGLEAMHMRLHRLREKFGVATTHGLIAKAARLGVFAEENRPE